MILQKTKSGSIAIMSSIWCDFCIEVFLGLNMFERLDFKMFQNAFNFWKLNTLAFSFFLSSVLLLLWKFLHLKFLLKITKVFPDKQKCNFSLQSLNGCFCPSFFLQVEEREFWKLIELVQEWSTKSWYDWVTEIRTKLNSFRFWLNTVLFYRLMKYQTMKERKKERKKKTKGP